MAITCGVGLNNAIASAVNTLEDLFRVLPRGSFGVRERDVPPPPPPLPRPRPFSAPHGLRDQKNSFGV